MDIMDHRSKKSHKKNQSYKQKRDLIYLFFILWSIFYPMDFYITVPALGLSHLFFKQIEKKLIL